MESGEREGGATKKTLIDDLPLFAATPAPPPQNQTRSPALDLLDSVHPDDLSPRDALDLIYKLKDAARD